MRGEAGLTRRLRISALASSGDGVSEDGIYVPYAAPGDVLDAEVEDKRGEIVEIIEPSPIRVAPPCPHFGVCGACRVQHVAAPDYRAWKREAVIRALANAGVEAEVADVVEAHGEGRRRVTFALKFGVAGYHRRGSHDVMPVETCPILAPSLDGAIAFAKAVASEVPDKWLSMLVTGTQNGLDADIKGPLHRNGRLTARLAAIARDHNLARLTAERDPVALYRTPQLGIGAVVTVVPPPGVFLQATQRGEEVLAHLAIDGVKRARKVADLFCGIGPFAIRLAARSQVYAADTDADAVAAMRRGVAIPGLKPVVGERRDLFRRPLAASELEPFDAVVIDPPFDGAAAQVAELARSRVPRISYVSCNPVTFARDAAVLVAAGYTLKRVTPVDQFLYSTHIELVGVFERS